MDAVRRFVKSSCLCLVMGLGVSACSSTSSFKDSYIAPVPMVIAAGPAASGGFAVSEEFDVSVGEEGDIGTVEFYRSETERFTREDGMCFLTMLNGLVQNGNWAKVDVDNRGWFLQVRTMGGPVSASARCLVLTSR